VLGVYVLSLSIAAAFVGSFARGVLAQFGFISGFMPAVYATLGVALLYVAAQLIYFALLRIYQPTRSRAMFATEALSSLAAIVLLPALLGIPVPGLSGSLERAAPLILVGVFGLLHLFFKVASFYAVLSGAEARDRSIVVWGLSGLSAGVLGVLLILAWRSSVEAGRVNVSTEEDRVLVGTQFVRARIVAEGASLSGSIAAGQKSVLALRFADANTGVEAREPLERLYVSVSLRGRETKLYQGSVNLSAGGWAELLVPGEFIPADATEYTLYWTRSREPNWQRIVGLRPIVYNVPTSPGEPPPPPAHVYVSGPNVYSERPAAATPNLLVVLVDGLGADHLGLFGYPRDVTPAIDRLGYRAQLFPNTISPGAGADFALFAAMTGEDPAQLGGAGGGPALPELLRRAGYATVAFVEAGGADITRDAPWATGFDIYDDLRRAVPAEGEVVSASSPAIARARDWIADHQTIPFLCLVRVRTLADFPPAEGDTKDAFAGEDGLESDLDKFDNALLGLDRQLGELFKFIRDNNDTRPNTCIIVTSPYSHEFSEGASRKFLSVPGERVPLIIDIPGRKQRKIPKQTKLHDLGATLAYLAGVRLPSTADGTNLVP